MATSRWVVWSGIAIAAATVAVYVPALKAPFQFDDNSCIPDNVSIRQLWPLSVPLHPPAQTPVAGRPVVNYTLALNYALNARLGIDQRPDPDGPDKTVGYHVFNLLLHLLSGALLFGVLRRTLRRQTFDAGWAAMADGGALVVTGIWLLHPIQSEAILYVVQRTELLAAACYLGTLYASIRAWDAGSDRSRLGWYGAAVGICLLGMGSKEVMISAPLMVVLYDAVFRWPNEGTREQKTESSPRGSKRPRAGAEAAVSPWKLVVTGGRGWFYLALCATSGLLIALIVGGGRNGSVGFDLGISWYAYLYSQAWAIAHYLRLFLWPNGLTLDYGNRAVSGLRGVPGLLLLVAFGVATIVALGRRARWGWFAFLGAWFFLLLAPSSSVVPITTEIAAERRIYLALVSIIVLLVVGLGEVRRRALRSGGESGSRRWVHAVANHAAPWLTAGVLLALAGGTFARGQTYRSSIGMWRDVVRKTPENPRGYDNLSAVMLVQTPPDSVAADSMLHRALAVDSADVQAWYGLSELAIQRRQPAAAISMLERALTINPDYKLVLDALGNLYVQLGQPERGIPYLQHGAATGPGDQAYVDLGIAFMAANRMDNAADAFRSALAFNPARSDALGRLGTVLTEQGHPAEGIPYLEAAARADPDAGLTLAVLASAYALTGHSTEAVSAARSAVAKADGKALVFMIAGRAMLQANAGADAEAYLTKAVELSPTDPRAIALLGDAKLGLGKRADAVTLYRRALTINPAFAPARQSLDRLTGAGGGPSNGGAEQ